MMSGPALWLSAAEIAALRLDGMPTTKRNINARILREQWSLRPDKLRFADRGGNRTALYHLDLLPEAARLDYAARVSGPTRLAGDDSAFEGALNGPSHAVQPPPSALPVLRDAPGTSAAARAALVHMAERFAKASGLAKSAADRLFCARYNAGAIAVDDWICGHAARLSPRSLRRWRKAGGVDVAALSDNRGRKPASAVLDRAEGGAVRACILALLVRQPHLATHHVRAAVLANFGDDLVIDHGELRPVPPLRSFQHYIAGLKAAHAQVLTRLTDPERYRSAMRMVAAGGASASIDRVNQLWEIDASPADVMLTDGRHSIYACIDVFSRRTLIHVSKTARAEAVGLLLRKAVLAWGVPEIVRTDHGSDFIARQSRALFAALDIAHDLCPPGRPDRKPFVERVIGTFQRSFVRTLPGFLGHSVAMRKRLEERRKGEARTGWAATGLFAVDLDRSEFQALSDKWAASYNATRHGTLGRAPDEQAALCDAVRRSAAPRALDVLLAPIAGGGGYRIVTKAGIRVSGTHYMSCDVGPGTRVFVRHDPDDLGCLWLFDEAGETYLGAAVAPELAGLDPAETIAKVRAAQRAFEAGEIARIRKAARRIGPRDVMGAVLDGPRPQTVVAFPKRTSAHETPALDAAADAARGPHIPELTDEQRAAHERLKAEMAEADAPGHEHDERYARFARARDLEAGQARGAAIDAGDALWLAGYQTTPEYRGLALMEEDFGAFYRPDAGRTARHTAGGTP